VWHNHYALTLMYPLSEIIAYYETERAVREIGNIYEGTTQPPDTLTYPCILSASSPFIHGLMKYFCSRFYSTAGWSTCGKRILYGMLLKRRWRIDHSLIPVGTKCIMA